MTQDAHFDAPRDEMVEEIAAHVRLTAEHTGREALDARVMEAVRRVPPESRGAAVAGYLVFFDLAFGVAIPFAGVLADVYAIRVVYLFGLVCSLAGLLLAARMVPAVGLPVLAKEAPDSVNE